MDSQQLLEAAQTIQIIQSLFHSPKEQNEWLPVIAAIGGAFVGGISTLFPSYLLQSKKHRLEKKAITTALKAEIAALVDVIEHRNYLKNLLDVISELQKGPATHITFQVKIPEHYSRVYQSHISRIGVVEPNLASDIIKFHQLIDAVIQDIEPNSPFQKEGGTLNFYEELVKILESALSIGKKITQEK